MRATEHAAHDAQRAGHASVREVTPEIGVTEADGLPGAGAAGNSPLIDALAAAAMNPPPAYRKAAC